MTFECGHNFSLGTGKAAFLHIQLEQKAYWPKVSKIIFRDLIVKKRSFSIPKTGKCLTLISNVEAAVAVLIDRKHQICIISCSFKV